MTTTITSSHKAAPVRLVRSSTVATANLRLAYWLTGALVLVALVGSVIGVLVPSVFHDPAMTAGNARGTAVTILTVALPALVGGMVLARRGSLRARIVWLGALAYLLYNSTFFVFAVVFNPLFLVYVATFSLALWSLVTMLVRLDVPSLAASFTSGLPRRVIAAYILISNALFAVVWLSDIVPALVGNTEPVSLIGTRMLTNPVEVVDLSITFPVAALAGLWLWRGRPWGYLLAGLLLTMLTIESASVATDQVFGHLADPTASLAAVPLFVVLTLVNLIPTVIYLVHLRTETRPTDVVTVA